MKRRGPTAEQLKAAYGKTVPDIIGPDLRILFVGINPSLYSAVVGHHFARPGNRFWPALHLGGLTEVRLKPEQDTTLLDYGIGLTNIASPAT
ncbi:MAG: mismatch-specific DNA-glycosylase, partial [Myxococcota bacterium]